MSYTFVTPAIDPSNYQVSSNATPFGINLTATGQNESAKKVFASFLRKILESVRNKEFSNLLNLPKPVYVSYPVSFLESMSLDWVNCTKYISEANKTNNPVMKLKLVAAGYLSAFVLGVETMKFKCPLDPILGETLTAYQPDGTAFYAEVVGTRPNSLVFQVIPPDKSFILHSYGTFHASLVPPNTIHGFRVGNTIVSFKNGGKIEIGCPIYEINGVMAGKMYGRFIKSLVINYFEEDLQAEIVFVHHGESLRKSVSSMANKVSNFIFSKKEEVKDDPPYDSFKVIISSVSKTAKGETQKIFLEEGHGRLLQYLQFGKEVYWRYSDPYNPFTPRNDRLPSDSSFREDRRLMSEGKMEEAQKVKDELEKQESADKTKRKNYLKKKNK